MLDININFSGGTYTVYNTSMNVFQILDNGTLSSNYTIAASGTYFKGNSFVFYYKATVNKASYNFNILGTNLTDLQLSRESTIEAVYNGTTWDLNVYINTVSDDWVASSISGTWENIPYDDGDIINSPATTGTYTNTAGTEGVNYLGQWRTYKGDAANYSATTPSARRLKYRKNLDGTVQVMGHLRKQFAVPAATTSVKLDDADYTNTIVSPTQAVIMSTEVLWYYQFASLISALGTNLVQILPCDLYVEDTTVDNNDLFSSNDKIWVGKGTLMAYGTFMSLYSADTITGLTASRNYTLSAFINASYIDL
jgi:hypothetical protein